MGVADHVGEQVRRRHAGVHAELHERHAELAPTDGVADVGGQRQAEPGTDGGPLTAAMVGTSSCRIESQAR